MGKLLTRSAILDSLDVQTIEVEVPEWGGTVKVRGLTGKERDLFEQASVRRNPKTGEVELNMANMRARMVAYCVVDEEGERMFTDADIVQLGRKSAAALERVAKAAQKLSGMGNEATEEAAGNFTEDPNVPSTTD